MRVISKEELDEILSAHNKWLEDPTTGSCADLSDADLKCADLSNVNLRYANLRGVELRNVDLRDADLSNVDLRDADLSNVDLRGANLSCANLRGANLSYAKLAGTQLGGTEIMVFQFNNHAAYCTSDGNIKIGCEYLSIEDWKDKYKEIGRRNCYTDLEIEMYGKFISMCEELRK